ncbi:MAG: hypothetical protein HQ472_05610 [Ignavibacteria bacterium]|nr:hypothetical protein [Ignavibacteria bacterium]
MKLVCFVMLLYLTTMVCSGQDSTNAPTEVSDEHNHPVTIAGFFEWGGWMYSIVSINGEVQYSIDTGRVHSKIGARIGSAISFNFRSMIPMMLIYTIGTSHRLEAGGGVVATYHVAPWVEFSPNVYKPAAHIGWRYEQTGGGWLFRGVITSLYDAGYNRFYTMFGLSAGVQLQFGK